MSTIFSSTKEIRQPNYDKTQTQTHPDKMVTGTVCFQVPTLCSPCYVTPLASKTSNCPLLHILPGPTSSKNPLPSSGQVPVPASHFLRSSQLYYKTSIIITLIHANMLTSFLDQYIPPPRLHQFLLFRGHFKSNAF